MKRPGEPDRPKKPGGKALERVKQFRKQRGLPVEPPKTGTKAEPKSDTKQKPNPGPKRGGKG